MANVLDVAAYILARRGPMTAMKRTVLYGYTTGGDSASLTFGADKRLLTRSLPL